MLAGKTNCQPRRRQAIGHKWHGIFFDGPQPDLDPEGEEIPVWVVFVGNDDADPVGTVYRLHHYKSASFWPTAWPKTATLNSSTKLCPIDL